MKYERTDFATQNALFIHSLKLGHLTNHNILLFSIMANVNCFVRMSQVVRQMSILHYD